MLCLTVITCGTYNFCMLKLMSRPKSKPITLKVPEGDLAAIREKADYYTNGNVSMWMRYAALNHRPKKADLIATEEGITDGKSKKDGKARNEEVYEGKSI